MFHMRRGAAEEPLRRLPRLRSVEVPPLTEPVAALVDQKTAATDPRHPCPAVLTRPAEHSYLSMLYLSNARGKAALSDSD